MSKPRLKENEFKELLFKELGKKNNQANLKTPFYTLLATKYALDKKRAFKLHDKYYSEYSKLRENKIVDITIDKELEALELALNDKNEHAKKLIEEIKALQEIKAGKSVRVTGTNIIVTATYSDELKAKAEIRAIRKQIGDWFGFNAPNKTELTGKDGKPLVPNKFKVIIKKKD